MNATLLQLSGKPLSRDLLRGYTGGLDYDSGSFSQSLRGGECGGRFLGVASPLAAHPQHTASRQLDLGLVQLIPPSRCPNKPHLGLTASAWGFR